MLVLDISSKPCNLFESISVQTTRDLESNFLTTLE